VIRAPLSLYLLDAPSTVAEGFFEPGDKFGVGHSGVGFWPQWSWLMRALLRSPPRLRRRFAFGVFFAVAEICHSGLTLLPQFAHTSCFSLAAQFFFCSEHLFDCSSSFLAFHQLFCTYFEGLWGHFETRAGFETDLKACTQSVTYKELRKRPEGPFLYF
jgi:hypothetical protein